MLKFLASKFPPRYQQELKRLHFGRHIKSSYFLLMLLVSLLILIPGVATSDSLPSFDRVRILTTPRVIQDAELTASARSMRYINDSPVTAAQVAVNRTCYVDKTAYHPMGGLCRCPGSQLL